jgi:hypothetical protein
MYAFHLAASIIIALTSLINFGEAVTHEMKSDYVFGFIAYGAFAIWGFATLPS